MVIGTVAATLGCVAFVWLGTARRMRERRDRARIEAINIKTGNWSARPGVAELLRRIEVDDAGHRAPERIGGCAR